MNLVWAGLLVVAAAIGWLSQLIGLPGNWIIVAAVAIYVWLGPSDGVAAIGVEVLAALVVLAVVGEVVEFVAGSAGVTRAGGSRRGALGALAGSMVGGVAGLFVGVPIPIVGSLAAALLFGGLGALVGAFLAETGQGRDFDSSFSVGKAAFYGRIIGTLGKMIVGSVMVIVTLAALIL
jgi:uncharacterized protein YqgC (DUF456 family)